MLSSQPCHPRFTLNTSHYFSHSSCFSRWDVACHCFPSSLSPGPCEDHCSSLLAHVPCWTQISFLPFNEEHLHFLLLDKTPAHDNSASRSWQSEPWHWATSFSLPFTNPASLLTLNATSCCRTRVGALCFALFLPLISSALLHSSCPGRVKG